MKTIASAVAIALTVSAPGAYAMEQIPSSISPIEGSLNYVGRASYLPRSPVGSSFTHRFTNGGVHFIETYRVDVDHYATLVNRRIGSENQ